MPRQRPIQLLFVGASLPPTEPFGRGLTDLGFRVLAVTREADGRDLVLRHQIDVMVVDLADGAAGTEILERLRACTSVPIVAMGADAEPEHRIDALSRGASMVITSPLDVRELAAHLRATARPPSAEPVSGVLLDEERRQITIHGRTVTLTSMEWKIAAVLASEPGRWFSPTELLELVWGHAIGPTSTVSVHIHRLRRKLERRPEEPELIRTERGRGYVFQLPPPMPGRL